tara:strand:+ start:1927 stop:2250 length:324 start_codon:yes stop_codon:yes gene_type:complete
MIRVQNWDDMVRMTCAFVARGESPTGALQLAELTLKGIQALTDERCDQKDEEEAEERKRAAYKETLRCGWCKGYGWTRANYPYDAPRVDCEHCKSTGYMPDPKETTQ